MENTSTSTNTDTPHTQLIKPANLTKAERRHFCKQYLSERQRGRTDLLWLCNEVLQYPDVNPEVHGPVIQNLQQFNGREEYINDDTFNIFYSEPFCAIHEAQSCGSDCVGRTCWYLDGPRWRMLLDPRGHLKTTVNTIAHSIQWIINFTDIRIALSTATGPQGEDILTEIENHFRFNSRFRWLYPEFCPADNEIHDWGSKSQFTVPCRRRKWLKEPTMKVISVGKVIAGSHYEVEKHSDLVDKENVKTPGGLKDVKDHFKYMQPLLERGPAVPGRPYTRGWVDLEGTIYDHSDLYCEELDKDEERASRGQPCRWAVFRRDSVQDPEILAMDPDTAARVMWLRPFKVLWPQRFPWEELRTIFEDIGEYLFNCQYRLRPSAKGMTLATKAEIGYFPAKFKPKLVPTLYVKTTVDLAGMEEDPEACNVSICTVGHDHIGRKYVLEALIGHPTPIEVINYLFDLDMRYSTGLTRKLKIVMEKAHHAQALIPFINRESELRHRWLDLVAIPRDTTVSKDNRIFYGLQPWFKKRLVWFSDDIPQMPHIVNEITKFPKYRFKDFLDSLADQSQDKDGKVDHQTDIPNTESDPNADPLHLKAKFLGFHPVTKEPMYSDDPDPDRESIFGQGIDADLDYHGTMTGVL